MDENATYDDDYFKDEEQYRLLEKQAQALEDLATLITQTISRFYRSIDKIDQTNLKFASTGDTRITTLIDEMRSCFVPLKATLEELKGYVGRLTMEALERKSQASEMRQRLNQQIRLEQTGEGNYDFVVGKDHAIGDYRSDGRVFKLTTYEGDPRNKTGHNRNDLRGDRLGTYIHHHSDRSTGDALHSNIVLTGENRDFPRNSESNDARGLFGV